MRILVIDRDALALDWCMRCIDDGHTVKWHVRQDEKTKYVGRGLVPIIADWREWAKWADMIVLAENTYYMREVEAHRKAHGTPVIGGTVESAEWEMDRGAGMAVFKRAGIPIPPFKEFEDYDRAIAYVKRENRRFVSKPRGDADKALSYCAKSPADMVYMLERWKRSGTLTKKSMQGGFMLQEFIEGTEMAVGAWFGPDGFLEGWCENFEFKKFMPGDLGIATGEQGTVLRYVKRSKLAEKVLAPVAPYLHKLGYVGYVDVNCIIDDEGHPWPLEFTVRFGWPTFNIQNCLHEGDHAEWLADLAQGHTSRNWKPKLTGCAAGVVMSIPDYPYSHATRREVVGIPLYGWTSSNPMASLCQLMNGVAPQNINGSVIHAPCLVSAGDYILVAVGVDDTVQGSAKKAYRELKKLQMPNSPMWRTDIGVRLKKQLPKLQSHGYALNLEY